MRKGQKNRKGNRTKAGKSGTAATPPTTTAIQPSQAASLSSESADTQRTKTRYFEAAKLLQESIASRGNQWGSFDLPELSGEPEDFNDSVFRDKINKVLEEKNTIKDQSALERCKHAALRAFTVLSPFAKNFLKIVNEGQSAFHFVSQLTLRSPY